MMHSANSYNSLMSDYRANSLSWLDRRIFRQQREILDTEPESEAALRVMHDLEKFGALFNLPEQLARQLAKLTITSAQGPLSVLEVCGGSCWFSRFAVNKLRGYGFEAAITATDWSRACVARHSRLHADAGISWEIADATSLPYADKQFDVALNIQALHHFEPDKVVRVLEEMCRTAHKVMLFDLRRTWYGSIFVGVFTPFFSRDFIHDGIISHRRAYSVQEIEMLIEKAGLPLRVRKFLPVGMLIESERS